MSQPEWTGKRFIRRQDLSPALRLIIAYTAWMSHRWGAITQLSKQYLISRTFVYMLIHDLENAMLHFFGEQTVVDTELAPRVSHNRDQPRQARDGLGSIAVNGTCHV